jgi:N utilization substance protein A
MKGSRVQAVVNELHGEKIDIVNWSENQNEFVAKALAPAKVASLRFNEAEHQVRAIVEDDQLSLAIGKEGQNVRLASRLTGWKIDLITLKEVEKRDKFEQRLQMDISEMYGVTPKLAQKLKGAGILTVQKLYRTPTEQLTEIEGIGEKTAEKLKNTAAETMEELNKALEELLKKETQEIEEAKPLFDEAIFGPEKREKKEEAPLTEEQLFKDLVDTGKKGKSKPAADTTAPAESAEERLPAPVDEDVDEDVNEEVNEEVDEEAEEDDIEGAAPSLGDDEAQNDDREEETEDEEPAETEGEAASPDESAEETDS